MSGPNVVMIVADQWAADTIGALGHPTVRTPHLDRLVERGTTFTSAYCAAPICLPSRTAMLTGRLPRRDRVYDNASELPADVPTVAHHLNRAGYRTAVAGKMHFVGPDQHHGFAERLTRDASPTDFRLTPDWTAGPVANPGTSVRRLRYAPTAPWTWQLSYDEEVTHRALERLRLASRDASPFFLCVSITHPHDPFVLPEPYWDRYAADEIDPPRSPAPPLEDLHPADRWIQTHHEADRFPLSLDETLRARRAYYAAVSYVDDMIGRVLGELQRLGMSQDTLIVVTSDHGEMLGEHGMWFKRSYRDPSVRVPLVVAGPGIPAAATRHAPVSLMDLVPTLLDLTDVPGRAEHTAAMDGRSLAPAIHGREEPDRPVFAEYLGEGTIEPVLMVRQAEHKYVRVRGHAPILHDLAADPAESRNLARQPDHARVVDRLDRLLLTGVDLDQLYEDVLRSQHERLLVAGTTPWENSWQPDVVPAGARMYPAPTA